MQAPTGVIDAVAGSPGRALKLVPLPLVARSNAPPAAAIWFIIFAIIAVAVVAFIVVNKQPKPLPLTKSSSLYIAGQNPSTVASFTSTYLKVGSTPQNDLWFLRIQGQALQYLWQNGNSIPVVVWDSINANCGPNLASYQAMVAYLTAAPNTGTVYSNQPGYSATLGVTTTWTNSAGQNIQFRLQLYAGDLRIEALNSTARFWSIFGPPNNPLPANWPSAVPGGFANTVWALYSKTGGTLAAFFLQNGELIVQTPATGSPSMYTAWVASVNQPEPPIC